MMDINFLKQNGVDVDKSLELFGDIGTYNDTIGDFLVSVNDKVPKLQAYKIAKDMPNYAIYAHSIKSDARYFGFTKLGEMAYEHELKSKAGDIYYIFENYDNFIAEINKTADLVKKYLEGTPADTVSQPTETVEATPTTTDVIVEEQVGEIYDRQTILVVDDSNIIRNFVSRIFKDTYNVGIAKDGKEAIDIIDANTMNNNIKAILLDLNMPKVDGFAVLDHMKENDLFDKIPVSIISGDSSKDTIDRAFTYTIVDMLGKPFNEADVKRVVEKTVYSKELA
ncbi:MAG: response regulator [Firmicutes bacterium]|nr:response regulator [Bacillota bacterium]